ncbi:MAG: VOC family protein [Planctomycetes bacterium]|nr:VOC family protein [Planctomycetota bacterium]
MPDPAPPARFRYHFNSCNDLGAMRRFYVELLGMRERSFRDGPDGAWLSVDGGGFEVMWFRSAAGLPVPAAFASQPGWEGGTAEASSWGLAIPEERFAGVWRSLRDAGVPLFRPVPEWRQDSYWGLSVLDPMGVTVEVYCAPRERPATTEWPEGGQGERGS